MLTLNDIEIRLQGNTLVSLPEIGIEPGEVVTLMGPSGSGKSTLLIMLLGTLAADFQASCRIALDIFDFTTRAPEQRRIGVCFQQPWLFPHMSVMDNLLFALPRDKQLGGIAPKAARIDYVHEQLAVLELSGLAEQMPATLSGGQAARIALLRALISQPRALLLDEPFAALDAATRKQVREWTFTTLVARQVPTLLVTHDEQDVYPDGRIVRLSGA